MNKKLYCSLAQNNIRKNKSTFYPFALSAMTMIALFFMIFSIRMQVSESNGFYGMRSIEWVLHMGVWICGIFASGVIFYSDKTALEGAWAIQYFGYGEKAYCKGCILGAGNTGHL